MREQFGSRLGFILISAGCAIGLGNVWRFPYITGQYGGAAFVVLYLIFLVLLALPILIMEFAVGRGSQRSIARSHEALEPAGSRWHWHKWLALVGNYMLMMFYTTVAGWMLLYAAKSAMGAFDGATVAQVGEIFNEMLADPVQMLFGLAITIGIGASVCAMGVQNGVERITKAMMVGLLVILVALCVRAVTLPGAEEGLAFYLMPDFGKLFGNGANDFIDVVFAAMGQAFFTVSVGIGSMSVLGSYTPKDRSLTGEALTIAGLDTLVALCAGLIIFCACAAFSVEPGAGPGLVFVTLPNVFGQMWGGRIWCTLFFVFMSFAALSTVIAVLENIMSFSIDQWGISRKKACAINGSLLFVLSLPCLLGFNVLSGVTVPGIGDIQGMEDFIVSNNILPIGALLFLLFCTSKRGWGFENFCKEADTGKGIKFPRFIYPYLRYVVPLMIVFVLVMGYVPIVSTWIGVA